MPIAMRRCFHKGLCITTKAIPLSISAHFGTWGPPKNTNIQHLTIKRIIQAVNRETNQYFTKGRCFDKFYSGQKDGHVSGGLDARRLFMGLGDVLDLF